MKTIAGDCDHMTWIKVDFVLFQSSGPTHFQAMTDMDLFLRLTSFLQPVVSQLNLEGQFYFPYSYILEEGLTETPGN